MDGETVNYATIIALSAAVVVGLVMLLIGSRLARVACALMGLVLGAAGGVAGAAVLDSSQWATLAIIAIGGVIGALVATALFRVWAAGSAALVMGLTAAMIGAWVMQPGAMELTGGEEAGLVADDEAGGVLGDDIPEGRELGDRLKDAAGTVLDRVTDEARQRVGDVVDRAGDAIRDGIDEGAADGTGDDEAAATDEPGESEDGEALSPEEIQADLLTALDELKAAAFERVGQTWGALDGRAKGVAVGAGAIAGGVALVCGVVMPVGTVTVAAAWLGGWLVALGGGALLRLLVPGVEGYLPQGQVAIVAVVSLITVVGVGVQWTVGRRKSDD